MLMLLINGESRSTVFPNAKRAASVQCCVVMS
jgi:hypothetical protein